MFTTPLSTIEAAGTIEPINLGVGSPQLSFWQQISRLNPILYLVNVFRYGFLGVSDVTVSLAFYFLIAFTTGLWLLCLWVLRRGVGLRS